MTTPRVTVPVEPTPLSVCRAIAPYLGAIDQNDWRGLDDDDAISMPVKMRVGDLRDLKAVISAAPAPSSLAGGEVDDRLSGAIGKLKAWVDLIQQGKRGEAVSGNPIVDCVNDLPAIVRELEAAELEIEGAFEAYEDAALATREEAPAEAGVEGAAWKWIAGRYPNDAPSDLAYDANELVDAFVAGASLRAQPPAREDAQPVARVSRKGNATGSLVWTDHGRASDLPDDAALFSALIIEGRSKLKREIYDNLCAADNQDLPLEDYPDRILSVVERYTHPAPDALRVAVEALEPFAAVMADIGESEDDADSFRNPRRDYAKSQGISVGHIRRAAQALAALQAEQKGGA